MCCRRTLGKSYNAILAFDLIGESLDYEATLLAELLSDDESLEGCCCGACITIMGICCPRVLTEDFFYFMCCPFVLLSFRL